MTSSATDLFISYKAEDRARLKPLVVALEAEGFSVWWDTHIGGGSNWRRDIEEHLDAAKCVIVAWTKRSVGPEGNFVRDEASDALKRGRYLPVRLDDVDPPLGFREVQAISLKGWKGDRSDPRFLELVDAVRERVTGEPVEPRASRTGPAGMPRRTLIAGGAGIGAVAVAGGGWLLLRPGAVDATANSIAVLPFENLSGDPAKAYFSDGMAEEIRSALARIAGVTVMGRTSSEAVRNDDAKTVARKLGVTNILTGSVRQSPSTIRITTELVDGRSGADRWSQAYDRSPGDAIKIQTDIAENVASTLSTTLGRAAKAAITLGGTANSQAQDLYLKAQDETHFSENSLRSGISLLDAALVLDPKFARAYAQKARLMNRLAGNFTPRGSRYEPAFRAAAAVARQSIVLAPGLAFGHFVLAATLLNQLDLGGAAAEIEKGRSLPDSDVANLFFYTSFLSSIGKADQAIDFARQAVSRDPLNPFAYSLEGDVLFDARRYGEAAAAYRKAIALGPKRLVEHGDLARALMLSGKNEEAFAEIRKLPPDDNGRLLVEALLFARQGNRVASDDAIRRAQTGAGDADNYEYAQIYADRGDREHAVAMIERAWEFRDPSLSRMKTDPLLDGIRSDPRFALLLKQMNFPS